MLLLAGTQENPTVSEVVGLEMQKRPLGASSEIYTDASFINCFQFNRKLVFINKGQEVAAYFSARFTKMVEGNTLDEVYLNILRVAKNDFVFVIDIKEDRDIKFKFKKYYATLIWLADVKLNIVGLRKFLIDDILTDL